MLDIMLRIAYLSAIGLSLYTSGWLLMKADKTRTTGALAACQIGRASCRERVLAMV